MLLDTHAIVWAGQNPSNLSARVRALLREHSDDIFVSAASAWEIATKVRLGRWPEARTLEAAFQERMKAADYTVLPVTAEHALLAGRLPGVHGDPFDRMIAAQALSVGVPVISIDPKLEQFGVRRLW